ncbi:arginase [bacterium]|jgi:arginase|nr:arginase [bacterium]
MEKNGSSQNTTPKVIEVIGAPIGLASPSKGVSLGPDAIRLAGLRERIDRLGWKCVDQGNLNTLEEPYPPVGFAPRQIRYLEEIIPFQEQVRAKVFQSLEKGFLPLVLGGDHSVAMGSISAINSYWRQHWTTPGLLWFDAHADLNTDRTSPSGNVHGMPLAVALGKGHTRLCELFDGKFIDPSRVVLFGVRSVDPEESSIVKDLGIKVFSMKDIDEQGAVKCIREAIGICSPKGEPIHISFDIDGVDERSVPGTGTPVAGGLTLREAHLVLELFSETNAIRSMDMVEVNPLLDHSNQTARTALSLIESALGKVIY